MTAADAMSLRKGDRVRVTMSAWRRRRSRLAVITDGPRTVGRWTLVRFAYARDEAGTQTLSRVDHYAQVPLDGIERAAA
jgi:hypothetical protein